MTKPLPLVIHDLLGHVLGHVATAMHAEGCTRNQITGVAARLTAASHTSPTWATPSPDQTALWNLILAEGGRWDPKRTLELAGPLLARRDIIGARNSLRHAAEDHPRELLPVEGKRWTYDLKE
ncbi:hypothetical protein [Streptomyces sp. URMC 129]|uniref:hypothetical protein n=1 Tax=Streptomyces sp. URMC 129 TaxID=3423407 RepID=UPI003F1A5F3A